MPKIVAVRPKADGEVEFLVDDDEGHADRHHAIAGGVAQNRKQRARRAEERRVQIEAAEIEQRHDDEQADFPTADQSRGAAFFHGPGGGGGIGHLIGVPVKPFSRSREKVARSAG
jgi:hypothetical protein